MKLLKFYQKLQEITDETRKWGTREIIMMGDFNGGTGCRKNIAIVEGFGQDVVYDNGERHGILRHQWLKNYKCLI